MNQIIAMTPHPTLERELMQTGQFVFCDLYITELIVLFRRK